MAKITRRSKISRRFVPNENGELILQNETFEESITVKFKVSEKIGTKQYKAQLDAPDSTDKNQ